MVMIRRRLMSLFLILCLMFLSTMSFAENGVSQDILPEVNIVSPTIGSNINVGYVTGINNPYGSNGAPIDINVEFKDSSYEFERLEFYSNNDLKFTSNEKKSKYQWWLSYNPSRPIENSIKVVCYYAGGIKAESISVKVNIYVSHVDRHYYKINGNIVLNMPTAEQNTNFLTGIKVSNCTLNQDGSFSCLSDSISNILVTRKNYLKIILEVPSGQYNCYFPSIKMIPGDIEIDGVQDGVINMLDVLQIAKSFNKVKGEAGYDESLDFNLDGNINITEVIMMSQNFGATVPTIKRSL